MSHPNFILKFTFLAGRISPSSFLVHSGKAVIGTATNCDIVVHDSRVSTQECRIAKTGPNRFEVVKLGKNALTWNGSAIDRIESNHAGEIQFLDYRIVIDQVAAQPDEDHPLETRALSLEVALYPPLTEEEKSAKTQARTRRRPTASELDDDLDSPSGSIFKNFGNLLGELLTGISRYPLRATALVGAAIAFLSFYGPDAKISSHSNLDKKSSQSSVATAAPSPTPLTPTPTPSLDVECESLIGVSSGNRNPTGEIMTPEEHSKEIADTLERLKRDWSSRFQQLFDSGEGKPSYKIIRAQLFSKTPACDGANDESAHCLVGIAGKVAEIFLGVASSSAPDHDLEDTADRMLKSAEVEKAWDSLRKYFQKSVGYPTANIRFTYRFWPLVLEAFKATLHELPLPESDREKLMARITAIKYDASICEGPGFKLPRFFDGDAQYQARTSTVSFCPSDLMTNSTSFGIVFRLARAMAESIDPCRGLLAVGDQAPVFRCSSTTDPSHCLKENPFSSVISCLQTPESIGATFNSSTSLCSKAQAINGAFADWMAAEVVAHAFAQNVSLSPYEYRIAYAEILKGWSAANPFSRAMRTADLIFEQPRARDQMACPPVTQEQNRRYCRLAPKL